MARALNADLGFELGERNRIQRWIVEMASTRPASRVNRKILGPADRFVLRLTGGKSTLTSWVSGLPVIWLTATGARSRKARTVPLLGISTGDDIAVIGTSFGQTSTPAWVHNLEAHPEATLTYQNKTVGVRARPASADEAAQVWETAREVYPGYANYAGWAPHREIRVFVLESPAPAD